MKQDLKIYRKEKMTLTQTIKDIFKRKPKDAKDNSSKGSVKRFLSKISGAFMLPVSVMAIAGLFLGIGASMSSNAKDAQEWLKTLGDFISSLGAPIFQAMPALFMVAVIISFTDDIGTAIFSGLIAFLIFNGIQNVFIDVKADIFHQTEKGQVVTNSSYDATGVASILGIGSSEDTARVLVGPKIPGTTLNINGQADDIPHKLYKLVGTNLGIQSMNTSVFGGIVVGLLMSWAYKRFNEVELPSAISFFGGKRFVAFVGIILMIPTAFIFLLVWPWIGIGLAYFGEYSGKVKGLDSFVFGVAERSLIPFGLHHVFYAPLWWTSAGGNFTKAIDDFVSNGGDFYESATSSVAKTNEIKEALMTGMEKYSQGDSFMWLGVSKLPQTDIFYTTNKSGGQILQLPIYEFLDKECNLNLGRFMQGKFPFMQMGLPAAGAAMVMAAPKENRKQAFSIIFPASLTAFLTGVTEPLEFTFVFLAPALFWGFHAIMAGLSFLMMNVLGAHVGMTVSGGIIDTVIYGILPVSKGTNFWWIYVIGAVLAPIYYFVFYFWIKKFDLPTPGRGGASKLITKADYKKSAANGNNQDQQSLDIIEAYGGKSNIVKTANCATRLRIDVKDAKKVSVDKLKAAGAMGVMKVSETHVQSIFGPKVEVIHTKLQKTLASMPASSKTSEPKKEVKSESEITKKQPVKKTTTSKPKKTVSKK